MLMARSSTSPRIHYL